MPPFPLRWNITSIRYPLGWKKIWFKRGETHEEVSYVCFHECMLGRWIVINLVARRCVCVGVGDCLCFVGVCVYACECVSGTHVSFVCKISETYEYFWKFLWLMVQFIWLAATLNGSLYTYLSKILSYKPFYTKCACLVWANKKGIYLSYLLI